MSLCFMMKWQPLGALTVNSQLEQRRVCLSLVVMAGWWSDSDKWDLDDFSVCVGGDLITTPVLSAGDINNTAPTCSSNQLLQHTQPLMSYIFYESLWDRPSVCTFAVHVHKGTVSGNRQRGMSCCLHQTLRWDFIACAQLLTVRRRKSISACSICWSAGVQVSVLLALFYSKSMNMRLFVWQVFCID